VPLHIPPLNDRREDIPMLAEFFLKKFTKANRRGSQHFAPEAIEYLVSSSWPGNIRQLINTVDLCATLCKTEIIPLSIVQKALQDRPQTMQTLKEVKQECEKNYLVSVLRICSGNVANAARIAGRNRTEFYKLLGQHELNPADFRIKDNSSE
jgi:two-component system response regulator GlrR